MSAMLDYEANKEAIDRVREIDDRFKEEDRKEVVDPSLMTRLMFEQMLRGLSIGQVGAYP
jgi:hypothetical protein